MSEIIIGIDLGTTNSCVAIKGNNPDWFTPKDMKGYSVIMDRLERKFTPSVLYYNGDPANPYEIGHNAKKSVDGKYPPVMFAKRHLGTDKKFQIADDKFITPVEVSAEVLKYLKSLAEKSLRQPVRKAVVTVPAYFGLTQKSLTREAMERAGFIVDDDRYIIIEPVAAALTYTQMVEQEALKIMVYDLGGGTFDITVLQKQGDFIEVVGFGGDHALGGYDFDRLLADHIIQKLQAKGYKLNLDTEKNPEDRIRYTKLMLQVEQAKIALSDDVEYKLRKPAIFEDQKGAQVDLDMTVDRPTFEALIRDKIDYTMTLCHETLDKTSFDINQINKIIMVGGSSYIPVIKKRLQEEFGQQPIFVEPDLCVALGASIQASKFGVVVEQKVRIKFDMLPAVTMFDQATISGVVSALDGKPPAPGHLIEISHHLGAFKQSTKLEGECGFFFEVPVQENCENIYTVLVSDSAGEIAAETDLKITHVDDADVPQVSDQFVSTKLSKTIYVKTAGGMAELAAEGVDLPFEKKEPFSIAKKGEIEANAELDLNVELYEGDLFMGEVNVTGIPGFIEEDAKVLVAIKITPDYKIHASAYIPSVGVEGKAFFTMKIEVVRSKEELFEDLHKLENDWEGLKLLLNREDLAKSGVRIDRAFKRAQDSMRGNEPDTTEASKTVAGLKQMLKELRGKGALVLRPKKEEFKKQCDEARSLIKEAEGRSKQARDMEMEKALDTIITQANQAYERRDQENWTSANRQVEELAGRAYQFTEEHQSGKEPDPEQLLLQIMMFVNRLKGEAHEQQGHPKYANWMQKLAAIQEELKTLGNTQEGGELLRGVRKIYQQKIAPLRDEIQGGAGHVITGLELK